MLAQTRRLRVPVVLGGLLLAAPVGAFLVSLFCWPIGHDSGAYAVHGNEIVRGGRVMYADLFENKPPGIFYVNAFAAWLTPWSIVGVRLLEVLALGFTAWGALRALSVVGGRTPASQLVGIAWLVLTAYHPLLYEGGNLVEPFMLPLEAWACALLLPGLHGGTSSALRPPFLAGLLIGAACLFRPSALGLAAAYALVRPISRRPGSGLREVAAFGGGAALAPAATLLAFFATGHLEAFFECVVRFPMEAYVPQQGGGPAAILNGITGGFWQTPIVPLLVVAALAGAGTGVAGAERRVIGLLALWAAFSLALVALPNRFYAHYFVEPALPLALLAAPLWRRASEVRLEDTPARRAAILSLVAALVAYPLGLQLENAAAALRWRDGTARTWEEITAQKIRELTPEDRPIQVMGGFNAIYLLARRHVATRHTHHYALAAPGWGTPERVREWFGEIERSRASAFVRLRRPLGTESRWGQSFERMLDVWLPHAFRRVGQVGRAELWLAHDVRPTPPGAP